MIFSFKKSLATVLINFGFCSARAANNFCLKNEIRVNGERIQSKKFLVSKGDEIFVNKEKITLPDELYFFIDKPKGFVTSHVSDSHKTVYSLVPKTILEHVEKTRGLSPLHTVGRLDCDSEGLLIFTTDGNFSHFYADPKNKIPKTYFIRLKTEVSEIEKSEYVKKAGNGIVLPPEKKFGEEQADSAELVFSSGTECQITVTEGKFHEVKRIFRALGNEVVHLKRTGFGDWELPASRNFSFVDMNDSVKNSVFYC